jgi:hypothetical protein
MATSFLPRRNNDGAAKRARDGDALSLLDEADAHGWSSAVSERGLALRRRWAPASHSLPQGSGWVAAPTATAKEYCYRREEAAAPVLITAGAAAEEAAMADPFCLAWFCIPDLSTFDAPPLGASLLDVTEPLLPPRPIILEARNDNVVVAADEHGCSREEAATPDAVGTETAAEETAVVDPLLSYLCLTL